MTRAQLVADLKKLIGPGIEVDDSGLITWLNDAYLYMVDEVSKVNPDFFTKSTFDSTAAGTQEYELPDDFEKMLMVNIQIDGEWRRALPLATIGQVAVHASTDATLGYGWGCPRYYRVGNYLGFLPIPDETTSNNIKMWYVYTPEELDADSDEPALPKKYHHLLKYGAYANYLDQDDEHVAAERMRNRFEDRVRQMVENLTDNQVDEPKSVAITTGTDLYYDDDSAFV